MMLRYIYLFVYFIYPLTASASLQGDWIVSHVYIDQGSTATPKITIDDPIYLNRIMQINNDVIKTNIDSLSNIDLCLHYRTETSVVNFNEMLNRNMAKQRNQILSTSAFGIDIHPIVNQVNLNCVDDEAQKWILFEKNENEYLLINNPFFILEIKKIMLNDINPSFSCETRLKISEHLICKNIYLSGLDRSIDFVYYQIQEQVEKDVFALVHGKQKIFIKQRDQCDNDECLMKMMSNQLLFLKEYLPVITF